MFTSLYFSLPNAYLEPSRYLLTTLIMTVHAHLSRGWTGSLLVYILFVVPTNSATPLRRFISQAFRQYQARLPVIKSQSRENRLNIYLEFEEIDESWLCVT